MKYYLLFLVTFLLGLFELNSQLVLVSGYIIHQDAGVTVPFANLHNKRNRTGAISDINGFYTILVAPGDTIDVTAVGFERLKLALPMGYSESTYNYDIRLKRTIYNLNTVNITLTNYERFKSEFESMRLPEKSKIIVGDPSVYKNYTPYKETFGYTIKGPFTALYNKFNRKARELEKLRELMQNDNINMSANMKLTKELINRVTGLTEDEEIEKLIMYCNIPSEFIANSTQYDLMVAIDRCYDSYTKDRGIQRIKTNNFDIQPVDTLKNNK